MTKIGRKAKITQNAAFLSFEFWHFRPIIVLLKVICLVTLFDRFLKLAKLDHFCISDVFLATQNVIITRFACNVV